MTSVPPLTGERTPRASSTTPPRRPGILRRRWLAIIGVLAISAGIGTYLPATLLAPIGPVDGVVADHPAPSAPVSTLTFPGYGASAIGAVGFEDVSVDGVLAASGSTDALPIASITKIITALVVLEARPLAESEPGPTITLSEADAALFGAYARINGKVVPSPAGLTLTERDMLEVVLVASANNYADSLSTWAFGSRPAFLAAVDAWTAKHGLTSTTIVEPTGMSPSNRSTAADLVRLGKLALADPVVSAIVSSTTVSVPGIGDLANSNALLGQDGVDGIKTGTLDEAGACLLFSADYPVGGRSVTIVGVVLGRVDHESLDAAIRTLLDGVETGFHDLPLTEKGQVFGSYATEWDATADAVAADDASVVVWSDTPVTTTVDVDDVPGTRLRRTGATGDDAAPVGSVTFAAGQQRISVPLVLDHPLEAPDDWWRLTHPFELLRA